MIPPPASLQPRTQDALEVLEQESGQAALEVVQPEIGPGSRLVDMRAAATPATAPYDGLSKQLLRQPLRRRSLFVTSAQTGDGTTTIAANLAAALSRQAQSVLLVELRLTAPHLLHLLGDPAAVEGFEDGLRGEVPLSDCIFRVASSSLTVIAAKRAMTEQEALAQSGSLNDFLEWAESRFDWLVLDCPSVSSSAWTRWFELNADPVLLVVRAGVTRQGAVKRVARQLKDRLAAAILNDSTAA